MIRILIGDDHAIVRKGLKQIVEENADMHVDEAEDGRTIMQKLAEKSYDIMVLDISLPDQNGLDILQQIRTMKPDLPVLILSMHPEEQYALRVLKLGAAGYLTKESAPTELVNAIRKIAGGGKYITSTLAERLADTFKANAGGMPHEALSDREFQVLCLIGSGKTLTDIAGILSLSAKTVSTYRMRIVEKTGLKNNAEIARYAIRNNLVT